MINPCTEEVREVNMKIQLINPGINQSITKDNVKLTISSSVAYRVINPILAYYILGNQLNHALIESTHSAIRNVIG
jgi:regulator of protease activity HflC (stomatin/prohibitin superfamily)